MKKPKRKPHKNIGSFLTPDQKEHADEVFEFLTKKAVGGIAKDCECDKLQADKAELLEALEMCKRYLPYISGEREEVGSLIQKMKQ